MTLQIKAAVPMLNGLNAIPTTHMVEKKTNSLKSFSDLHTCTHISTYYTPTANK